MSEDVVHILLVEDNPDDAELTLHALKAGGLTNRILVARDGAEALALLFGEGSGGETRPQVVLLDLKLPKVSGLEVLRRIKADERLRTLPVVILTSSREGPDIRAAYDLGANSYIVKPVDFDQFQGAVRQLGFYWLLLNQPHGS